MKIRATLTGTNNEYLAPNLPIVGEIEILETDVMGRIVHASFQVEYVDGTLAAPVQVGRCQFTVGGDEPAYPAGRHALPAWKQAIYRDIRETWTEEERRQNAYQQRANAWRAPAF